jgi:predicted metal-dependent hydrolase
MEPLVIDRIIRSKRRTLALQITPQAQLVVRAPWWLPVFAIRQAVGRKSAWILKKQAQAKEQAPSLPEVSGVQDQAVVAQQRERARRLITERVRWYAQKYGFEYSRIRINSARTRWGSCGPSGSLNFTWRLVLTPLPVIDYVVVHELAHLRVRGHSARFWAQVERILPDYRCRRAWLRENERRIL